MSALSKSAQIALMTSPSDGVIVVAEKMTVYTVLKKVGGKLDSAGIAFSKEDADNVQRAMELSANNQQ